MKPATFLPAAAMAIALVAASAPAQLPDTPTQPDSTSIADLAGGTHTLVQTGAGTQTTDSADGISIVPTTAGAKLSVVFQNLQAKVTTEGLWLESTAAEAAGSERFRVLAAAVGRAGIERADVALTQRGEVKASPDRVAFLRCGMIEEYTVAMDGIRQDFVVMDRPAGAGELRLTLQVTGARAESAPYGAKLFLEGSGREIAYHRLHVTDAAGRVLEAGISVIDGHLLEVLVADHEAAYPIRIDPTFSDADWHALGPGIDNGDVYALAVSGTNLYAGGWFTKAGGGTTVNRVAKWDGSTWSALGSGVNNYVNALAVVGGDLYAGGTFTEAGGSPASYIAKWDGVSWSAVGSGMDNYVNVLLVSGTDIYAGGQFQTAGGVVVNNIAKWDGSSWSALGAGTDAPVMALAESGSDLFVGGAFTTAGGVSANHVARWNGSGWSAMGVGASNWVRALAVFGHDLIVGGNFVQAGGMPVDQIARWDGSAWHQLGSGVNGEVRALTTSGLDLYVGGPYISLAGGVDVRGIAKWNGVSWSALGSGVHSRVLALARSGPNVYVGGGFTKAGGKPALFVARAEVGIPDPDISVEEPAGNALVNGDSVIDFGSAAIGFSGGTRTLTVKNLGTTELVITNLVVTGPNADDFIVDASAMDVVIAAGESTLLDVTFAPAGMASSRRSMTLQISNNDLDDSRFAIALSADAYSPTGDVDGDGLSDWAEHRYAPFGFDWQVSQAALVDTLFSGAAAAGLYTPAQVQALHFDVPLIQRDLESGWFNLTIGIGKSSDLVSFEPFPLIEDQIYINDDGELVFEFEVPDDTAFFRLESR